MITNEAERNQCKEMCFFRFYAFHEILCAYTRARGDRPFCGRNSFFHLGLACAPERESSPEFLEWKSRPLSSNLGSKNISIIFGTGRKSKLIFLMESYFFFVIFFLNLCNTHE